MTMPTTFEARQVERFHEDLWNRRDRSAIAEPPRVFARMTFRGIHRGLLLGHPPTGRQVTWSGAALFAFADGKVVDLWVLGDLNSLEDQLRGGAPMTAFAARTKTLEGTLTVSGGVDDVFPLFSPRGERLWVPGWDPEVLHPPESAWCEGQIFRTQEERGEAVWVITRLVREAHRAEYHRVEPGRYVAHVAVRCRAISDRQTQVAVSYSYVGLSEDGNREIEAMSTRDYDAKLARWSGWIERYRSGSAG